MDELCLRVLVRACERACAQGNAAFAPFSSRAWLLRVAVECPASHGMRVCGRACVHVCERVCIVLLALGRIASCARCAACVEGYVLGCTCVRAMICLLHSVSVPRLAAMRRSRLPCGGASSYRTAMLA